MTPEKRSAAFVKRHPELFSRVNMKLLTAGLSVLVMEAERDQMFKDSETISKVIEGKR